MVLLRLVMNFQTLLNDIYEGKQKLPTLTPKACFTYAALDYTCSLFERIISISPEYSLRYARNVIERPFPEGEDTIATDPSCAYRYALDVLKGRFEKGEDAISKDPILALQYAKDVLRGRFEKGEDTIAQSSSQAFLYAKTVLKGRFELGEDAISKDYHKSYCYAVEVLKGRFEKGENEIAKSARKSYFYALNVIRGRFEKGEEAIGKSIAHIIPYINDVIKWDVCNNQSSIKENREKILSVIHNSKLIEIEKILVKDCIEHSDRILYDYIYDVYGATDFGWYVSQRFSKKCFVINGYKIFMYDNKLVSSYPYGKKNHLQLIPYNYVIPTQRKKVVRSGYD